ncbi:MAG: hypothetical protein LUP94_00020, partial [Candidatus Methanomethylicus sp.]|nr:hypothetical protein [Candidatus Methanomethylicus sp.]
QTNEGKPLASKSASSDYRTKYAWIYVPVILGSLYVLLNAYVYQNIHIIIPALFLGSLAAMLNHPLRTLLRSIMIASVTVAIVAGIVLFEFSLYAVGLLFSVSFIFILIGGVASWYMTKWMKRKFKA